MPVNEEDIQEVDLKLTDFLLQKPWYAGTEHDIDVNADADAGTGTDTSLSSSASSRVSDSSDHTGNTTTEAGNLTSQHMR